MLRFRQDTQRFVPLKRVNITATIRSFAADVNITQVFRNDETTPIEAVYCFPIEEQAAVYAFVARIDDREIVSQLKEKETAQNEYNEALRKGHGAYLLEQDEKSQDNFIINVGTLLPGKECQIVISYVSELNLVENGTKIRFVIPTTIAPRYNPDKGDISSPAGTTSEYMQISPYTIGFHCQVEKNGVSRISSISHPIQVDVSQQDIYVITFAQDNTHLDRDILIDVERAENRSNTMIAVESGAVMAAFTPSEEDCQRVINNIDVTNEFIFVVDCSGSMQDENKIGLARQAMLLFLKSLPVNCYFNILRFGSEYEALFKEITVLYNEESTRKAERLTEDMKADLGGTELLRPLQWLEENPPTQGRVRQIFLLTDGEISNVNQVLDLCRTMATSTRIFSFGLGRSPNRSLVKGLARATNGRFVFIPPDSSVDVHVGEQLQKALQPCITNVQIKWHLGTVVSASVPTMAPPVYVNDRLIVYALIEDKSTHFDHNSSVELTTEQHRLGEAKVTRIPSVDSNEVIARLAAKALIIELQHSKLPLSEKKNTGSLQTRFKEYLLSIVSDNEEETSKETTKERIIQLSLKYNILSPYTAFVGIEQRVNASNTNMVLREVPIQIAADDQHLEVYRPLPSMAAPKMLRNMSVRSTLSSLLNFGEHHASNYFDRRNVDYCIRSSYGNGECGDDEERGDNEFFCDLERVAITSDEIIGSVTSSEKRKEDVWPTNNQDIVRHLIDKQKFDGSWDLDSTSIERLTGKPLTIFQQLANNQVLISAIVIAILETRFASFSSMWHGVVQKARKRLIDLLGKDIKKLDALLEDIRKQL